VINLDELEPLAAAPSSPDNIVRVADIAGQKIAQIGIGSCTNSSYWDLMTTAAMLKDHTVHPGVELAVAPGSRQVLSMIAANGALADLVAAGARIMESACGPCIGVGFSPADGAVSLRTFNRNFAGRSGTGGDKIFLVSPETAAASALAGEICDPREAARKYGIARPVIKPPGKFALDDGMLQQPLTPAQAAGAEVIRGSTIIKPPGGERPPVRLDGAVIIKVGDKITTDHIMPAGSMLKFRSNVPEYAKYVFNCFNEKGKPSFADRALAAKAGGQGGVIVAGESYGQGSSREHAALCPMYLGVRAVIARSIERIHQANLVNFGIVPLTLATAADYDRLEQGDRLVVEELAASLAAATALKVVNLTRGCEFTCQLNLAPRQRKILAAGGLLAYTREGGQ
jgi:aconitate hydratase